MDQVESSPPVSILLAPQVRRLYAIFDMCYGFRDSKVASRNSEQYRIAKFHFFLKYKNWMLTHQILGKVFSFGYSHF